jgi:hypothetical protein
MTKLLHSSYILLLLLVLSFTSIAYSQKIDSTKVPGYFGGSVTVNTKGISSIPNLTLGKPAAIFFLSAGRKLRFEPEFRFALEGKPWIFILWGRYDFVNNDKFLIRMRANYGLAFKTVSAITDDVTKEILTASPSFTGDLTTSYFLTKNIGIGPYYFYRYGIEKYDIKNTHYIGLKVYFSNLYISKKFYIGFNPQVYYLNMDADHGYYLNSTFSIARRNFPLSISALVNWTIQTEIPVGEDFLWNVGLIYTFNKKYVEQQ